MGVNQREARAIWFYLYFCVDRTMNDQQTTILQLREMVRQFVADRDWHQFHSPKNLSMALAIEAAELMEHFSWITTDASRQINHNPESLRAVEEEMADVLCYVLAMANELNVDLRLPEAM